MDYRKLIEFGNGSYIITMPRSWVKSNQLRKGDLISIEEKGPELILGAKNASSPHQPSEIVLETSGKDIERIKAEIVSSYLNGIDTLIIHTRDLEKNVSEIKQVLRNLSGMEIMEHNSQKIVAKNILNPTEIPIEHIIRRMDVIIRSMVEDTLLCATGGYSPLTLTDRDLDVNRLYFLGSRIIRLAMMDSKTLSSMNKNPWQLHSDRLILIRLEKIADCQKRIARELLDAKLDRASIDSLRAITTQFQESFERTMKSYYATDRALAFQIQSENNQKMALCNDFLSDINKRLIAGKQSAKQRSESHTSAAKITENLKSCFSQLKYMARYVICY